MSDRVYLVCLGEYGEGHDPVSAFSTFVGALSDAMRRGADRRAFSEKSPGRWKATLDGCDVAWIIRLPIDDKSDIAPAKPPVLPRGVCGVCTQAVTVNKDGRVRNHKPLNGYGHCAGSRRAPLEVPS